MRSVRGQLLLPSGLRHPGGNEAADSGPQTIWEIPDISDNSLIKPAKKGHNAIQLRLQKKFHEAGIPGFLVGASGCSLCSPCHLKNGEPCPHPEERYSCMSAYCIFVRKLAEHCGMDYDCGEGLLALFGMYVFD